SCASPAWDGPRFDEAASNEAYGPVMTVPPRAVGSSDGTDAVATVSRTAARRIPWRISRRGEAGLSIAGLPPNRSAAHPTTEIGRRKHDVFASPPWSHTVSWAGVLCQSPGSDQTPGANAQTMEARMAVPDRSGPNQSGPNRSRRQFLQ